MAKAPTLEVRVTGDVLALREALKESTALLAVLRGDEYEENVTRQIDRNTDVLSAPLKFSDDTGACRPMDLDEAIEHARACAARWGDETPCGYAHAQLACWLCELREHRKQAEDAYAMRKTLENVERVACFCAETPRHTPGYPTDAARVENLYLRISELGKIARKALAGRPRNCDLYKDCDSAWKAYNALDKRERLPGFDYWLFEEAKQEGGAR